MRDIIFFNVIAFSPIYGVLIWLFFCPKECLMWGKRWMLKEEPEISDEAIRYTKVASIISIMAITLGLVVLTLQQIQ